MKTHLGIIVLIISLLLLINCSDKHHEIKSTVWTYSTNNKEFPHKFEFFDKNGIVTYDSTLFISGLGYRVNRYHNGKIISSVAKFDPGLSEWIENKYDSSNNLVSSVRRTKSDTSVFHYRNKYDKNNYLVDVLLFLNGDTIAGYVDHYSYIDSLREMEETYKLNGNSSILIRKKNYGYDRNGQIIFTVIRDYQQLIADSTVINYKQMEKKIFRSIRKENYEVVSVERILKSDSSEIEIRQPKDKIILIKKKSVEYW